MFVGRVGLLWCLIGQFTICNSWNRYLTATVRRRSNLSIRTGSTVERLILDSSTANAIRCNGVVFNANKTSGVVRARKEVLLCAGAIGSPHLLQVSGVGDRSLLESHGVSVVCCTVFKSQIGVLELVFLM